MSNIKMLKLCLLILLGCLSFTSFAEGVPVIKFSYDAAGNRVERTIVIETRSAKIESDTIALPPVIDNSMSNEVSIYPNPTKGLLTIDIKDLEDQQQANLKLLDINGRPVLDRKNLHIKNEIDFTNTPAGTYVLQLTIDKKTTDWKIIKK